MQALDLVHTMCSVRTVYELNEWKKVSLKLYVRNFVIGLRNGKTGGGESVVHTVTTSLV